MPSKTSGMKRSKGHRVIRFIEEHCVHTNGQWIGKPFRLLPWQKRLILELFEVDDKDRRKHRWALVGTAKKNGKTELFAAIGLYLLIADGEPAPLVVCAAASDDQADLIFGAAKTMCEMSDTLSALTERYDKEILVPSIPGAVLRRVAAVAGTNDGQNIHAALLDELHEWRGPKGEATWNVLTNGTGAREQPLILQTTTAGYDIDGTICGREYKKGKDMQAGLVEDPAYYFKWFEPSTPDSDYRDPDVWKQANPSYGVLVHEAFFKDQLTKKTEAVFRRYFLNQWTASEEIWLPAGAWDACRGEVAFDPQLPLYVGIDVGIRHDSSAVAIAQKQGEKTLVSGRIWQNPYLDNDPRHLAWTLNIAEVEAYLRELRKGFPAVAASVNGLPVPGPAYYYDPTFFERSAQELDREDRLAMVELPQNNSRMIPVSQAFYDLVVAGQVLHAGDPAQTRHINNVIADETGRGWRMSKPKGSTKKIDWAIAAGIAVWAAQQFAPVEEQSVYEERGLLVL